MGQTQVNHGKNNQESKKQQQQHVPIDINLVFVGGSYVGKTWIRKILANQPTPPKYKTTIAVDHDFINHTFTNIFYQDAHGILFDQAKVHLQLSDTSGNSDFKISVIESIKKADGVIFVFANNDKNSLRIIKEELLPLTLTEAPKNSKMMLVCNKTDLQRQVNLEELGCLKNIENMIYEQVCAKNGENVQKSVLKFAKKILKEKIHAVDLRDMYMNMLLFFNEDFDDDLLQDSIVLLEHQ